MQYRLNDFLIEYNTKKSCLLLLGVEPALLTEFRSEGGEAQVPAGFVANQATQS
jgi:hypothetical protein